VRGEVWDKGLAYCRQALALASELRMRPLMAHCHLGLGTLYTKAADQMDQPAAIDTLAWKEVVEHSYDERAQP
jgi:hypothetical protein